MAKVLVVGGLGFVGAEIVRQSRQQGDDVTVLDRLASPDESIDSIQADLTNADALLHALKGRRFDVIQHTASFPGDTGDAVEMVGLNVLGLMNMLEWAKANPVNRLVVTGSICAYGWYPATPFTPPKYLPVDEDYPVSSQDMKDMYCSTKKMQELLAMSYWHKYKVPTCVLRLTTVIGPAGKGGGRGWRDFATMLKEGRNVQIPFFTPEELYHFVDIRDVARMHLLAGTHPLAVGEIFNCGAKANTRGRELIEIVKKLKPGIEVSCGFPWSMSQGGELWFDVSKARRLIGFEAKYTVEDSVRSIRDWVNSGGLEAEGSGDLDNKYGGGLKSK